MLELKILWRIPTHPKPHVAKGALDHECMHGQGIRSRDFQKRRECLHRAVIATSAEDASGHVEQIQSKVDELVHYSAHQVTLSQASLDPQQAQMSGTGTNKAA